MTSPEAFTLLSHLYGDHRQQQIFTEHATVESWLAAERALARAQAAAGVLTKQDADAIDSAARWENIDTEALWGSARNVGYPILGLVRAIATVLPEGPNGRVHYGATTQDIMDTGLALQLSRSLETLKAQVAECGNAIADLVERHQNTVLAARTHAQHAVPTTLGATLATLLAEFTRHRERLYQTHERIAVVSLFGAGGTAAGLGSHSRYIRQEMARILGLAPTEVSWHTARDRLAEFGHLYISIAATCARIARNVVDLSRTEIGELGEPFNDHRGASSTMPQKVNPISSEAIIGLSQTAAALASAFSRVQEAGHERAAGEWQIEWEVLPRIAVLTGSCLAETTVMTRGLRVDAERMRANLGLDAGLVMAEAHMISLAATLGREHAHELVYAAVQRARDTGETLTDLLPVVALEQGIENFPAEEVVSAEDYLGEAVGMACTAVRDWGSEPSTPATETRA